MSLVGSREALGHFHEPAKLTEDHASEFPLVICQYLSGSKLVEDSLEDGSVHQNGSVVSEGNEYHVFGKYTYRREYVDVLLCGLRKWSR